jgi:hypothetical protein
VLTPVEELGLSGLGLASRVRIAFHKIPDTQLLETMQRVREESLSRRLVYLRDGQAEAIHLMLNPLTALPDQMAYIHFVTLTIHNALKRLPELYFQDFAVREILRLTPGEEKWLWDCWGPGHRENNPIFGRHDAVVDFTSPMWKNTLCFMEPNMSGIGGLHLVPTAENILAEALLPLLHANDPHLHLEIGKDIRELLMQDVLDHMEAIGRQVRNICFVEPKYAGSGPDEQESLARYYHDRYGLKVMHADPAELTLQGAEVYYRNDVIDVAYRDYPVSDLIDLEHEGENVEPMRLLFRQNRIISSIGAEIDQKSCWEVLTDPELAQKYFSPDERQVFRRHVLWTRLVSDRKTQLPDGQTGDLLEWLRREREILVLKPNRSFGGEGVTIGAAVTQEEWEMAIERALADKERWVVQRLANIPVCEFPVADENGRIHVEPFHVVMGFAPSKYGLAVLGRASQKQVVNVALRGGLCVLTIGAPPPRFMGPRSTPTGRQPN